MNEPGMSGRNVFFFAVPGADLTAVLSCEKPATPIKMNENTSTDRSSIGTFKNLKPQK
jgi:hypothetical protein